MSNDIPVYIGEGAVERLIAYCEEQGLRRLLLVADTNTCAALGDRAGAALAQAGFDVKPVVLDSPEVVADAAHVMRVLVAAGEPGRTYVAVGSGTLTDITRFASHRTGATFISLPTAASVDGFTSIGAPLVLDGLKQTVICQAPQALFADLRVLCDAPHAMTASGFGDMVGKLMSVADFELGHRLWDERYDESVTQRMRQAAMSTAEYAEGVGRGEPEAVRELMRGLLDSGFLLLEFGNSNPASGAEHHMSHYWEMLLLRQGRKALLHGAKVGVAATLAARLYEQIRAMDASEAAARLERAALPDAATFEDIQRAYGPTAAQIRREQAAFLNMDAGQFAALKARIITRWADVQAIAARTPTAAQFTEWLQAAGAPTEASQLGLTEKEVWQAAEYGHYLRNRFTVLKLAHLLGLPMPGQPSTNRH